MSPQHLDRLTSVDAGFLHLEDGTDAHMHIGGLAVFEGPPPQGEELAAHIRGRLPLVPRYRQKLAFPPAQTGRPLWVDDPDFNLDYHVRRTALPAPGGEEELRRLVGRIASQRLDRTKPLWEMWVVEGLEGDRWALVNKTHHALVDGVGGVDITTALVDLTPEPRHLPEGAWVPEGTPGRLGLLARGVQGAIRNATGLATGAAGAVTDPLHAATRVLETARGLGELAETFLDPAPPTPLNRAPGPHRRFATVETRLADYKEVKDLVGGTVNDVVLSVVAGALGRFLHRRGMPVDDLVLRACVPVSLRTDAERGEGGNRITVMAAQLPVGVADPLARLAVVRRSMEALKASRQAVGAATLARMENFMPPTVLAQASRLSFSPRLYNLIVTNVPGPQFPVYVHGRRMLSMFPLVFLPPTHLLDIAIISYDGQVNLGLLADYDGVPDLDVLAAGIGAALADLLTAARAA